MKDLKIYDAEGTELHLGDKLDDGTTLEQHWGEYYIVGERDMWRIEEFTLTLYKDGVKLIDFRKAGN